MVEKMQTILENLKFFIGEETLKKFGEETVSAMVAPYARPLGVSISRVRPGHEPPVEDSEPEGPSILGGKPRLEKGGASDIYGKESPVERKERKLKEDVFSKPPKEEEPKGKAPLGKDPEITDDGDPKQYGKEKTVRELGRIKENDALAEPGVEEPEKIPAPVKKDYEIYVKSTELAAAEARAEEVVKPIVGDAKAYLCVKFSATEDALAAAKEALNNAGFVVVGEEEEKK